MLLNLSFRADSIPSALTTPYLSSSCESLYDPVARKIYVNLQDQNIFAVIDPTTDEVVGRYSVGKCEDNHGMAVDPEHRRALLEKEKGESEDHEKKEAAEAGDIRVTNLKMVSDTCK